MSYTVFGLFLISCIAIIAAVEHANNRLQDFLARRRFQPPVVQDTRSHVESTAADVSRSTQTSLDELRNGTDYEVAQERFRRAQREASEWEPGR